jgi:hydroxypyruvate reductase/glycerate 2-kinase
MISADRPIADERELLSDIFRAALRPIDPYRAVARHMDAIRSVYEKGGFSDLHVCAFGKAAPGMVRACMDSLGDILTNGVAVTKYGHWQEAPGDDRISMYEAGHPLPDENGVHAALEAMQMIRGLDEKSLLVCLISGGGSALLVAPLAPVLFKEKQHTIDLLLRSGADIHELNAVRKHISAVKGGRLAGMAFPARISSLILSDVIDDRLDVIASGPFAPDETTYGDALGVLDKYGLGAAVPRRVYDLLTSGAEGRIPETLKKGNPVFQKVDNTIVGNNEQAIAAAGRRCAELGFAREVVARGMRGEATDAARWLAEKAREMRGRLRPGGKAVCLIAGGETTVTVRGQGVGGRNMELALAFAIHIEGEEGITLLSAGTDGTDGPTDAAGAVVDGRTAQAARAAGLDPVKYLEDNNSYTFFKSAGGLFITGPTGTNVMDIQILLLRP